MKRRRQSERDKPTYVVLAITEWGWSYSFGINDTDLLPGPYWGTDHLEVSGDALLPSGLTAKPIELTLVPGARWPNNQFGGRYPKRRCRCIVGASKDRMTVII